MDIDNLFQIGDIFQVIMVGKLTVQSLIHRIDQRDNRLGDQVIMRSIDQSTMKRLISLKVCSEVSFLCFPSHPRENISKDSNFLRRVFARDIRCYGRLKD